jgi:hypothetical protein
MGGAMIISYLFVDSMDRDVPHAPNIIALLWSLQFHAGQSTFKH